MDPMALRDHLTKLHEELRAAPRVDADSSQLLGELMQDIKQLMARSAGAPESPASLPDRLEKIAVLFEVDHPTLAASSRRLVDLLGKAGL
jgi:hypothetical protein